MAQQARGALTPAVARRVVQTIAPRIEHPLNLMDEHGVIIASSSPRRVGATHPDALRALAEHRTIVTRSADAATGSRPGVNVPLVIDGALRGVVGVTGDPAQVEALAQLISLTVQLLLAARDEHVRETRAGALLSALASGAASASALADGLRELGLAAPYTLSLLLEAQDAQSEPPAGDAVLTVNGATWVLRSGAAAALPAPPAELRALPGTPRRDADGLLLDAQNWRTLRPFPALIPRAPARELWDAQLALAAARTPDPAARAAAAAAAGLGIEQARTLLILASCASHLQAAERLGVHRNTLIQRLERIRALTGADPRIPRELLALFGGIYARARLGELHIF